MTQNAINSDYPNADGELLIGATGARPLGATITAGSGITVTNAANAITLTAAGGGSGDIIQILEDTNTAFQTITGAGDVIFPDNTIPQITEGVEIFSLSITPTSATSILNFEMSIQANFVGNGIMALFQNPTADAIGTFGLSYQSGGNGCSASHCNSVSSSRGCNSPCS